MKYLTRWRDKGGVQDLHKARRYLEQMREDGVIVKVGKGYTLAQA